MRGTGCDFTPAARLDLLAIGDYIARDNPIRADSFVDEIERYCRSIASAPHAYPAVPELGKGIRRASYGRYLIFYTVNAEALRIERILHGARDIGDDLFGHPPQENED